MVVREAVFFIVVFSKCVKPGCERNHYNLQHFVDNEISLCESFAKNFALFAVKKNNRKERKVFRKEGAKNNYLFLFR